MKLFSGHLGVLIGLSMAIYSIYLWYVWTLFENDRHFSHLSELEREMSFRSEMALYYRYYKIFVQNKNWTEIYEKIFSDQQSQAPDLINAFSKYSILPEIVAGLGYRLFSELLDRFELWDRFKQCWMIQRDSDSPIESCEGLADSFYFYLHFVFSLNSWTPVLLLVTASIQSNRNYLAALFTAAMFAFNQSNCSRIQWAPPLRESFGYPLFLLNNLLIIRQILQSPSSTTALATKFLLSKSNFSLFIVILLQLFCWQFSSFLLLIQFGSLYFAFDLFPLNPENPKWRSSLFEYSTIGVCATLFQTIIQYPNFFALESFYFALCCSYLTLSLVCKIYHSRLITNNVLLRLILLIFFAFLLKLTIGQLLARFRMVNSVTSSILFDDETTITDDSHIWSILAAKFFPEKFANFHTLLYTCAREFDFMTWNDEWAPMFGTLVLPTAVIGLLVQLYHHILCCPNGMDSVRSKLVLYHLCLTILMTIVATLIMRLKILLIPQLCLVSGFVFWSSLPNSSPNSPTSLKPFRRQRNRRNWKLSKTIQQNESNEIDGKSNQNKSMKRFVAFGLLLVIGSFAGVQRIRNDLSIVGEFSNPPLEELIDFIRSSHFSNNNLDNIFAGSMSTMANLLLSTEQKIANNPFYESVSMRARTYLIYQLYSSHDPVTVHSSLRKLSIDYILLEKGYCYGRLGSSRSSGQGESATTTARCRMSDIWKLEDERRIGSFRTEHPKRKPICQLLFDKEFEDDEDLAESGPIDDNDNDPIDRLFRLVFYNDYYSLFRLL